MKMNINIYININIINIINIIVKLPCNRVVVPAKSVKERERGKSDCA